MEADENTFVMYAAFGDAGRMRPVYDALEAVGCKIEVYDTKVPGIDRPFKAHDRNPTGLLSLMDGELSIVHAPADMTHDRFKEIVDPIKVDDLVDVYYPQAQRKYTTPEPSDS